MSSSSCSVIRRTGSGSSRKGTWTCAFGRETRSGAGATASTHGNRKRAAVGGERAARESKCTEFAAAAPTAGVVVSVALRRSALEDDLEAVGLQATRSQGACCSGLPGESRFRREARPAHREREWKSGRRLLPFFVARIEPGVFGIQCFQREAFDLRRLDDFDAQGRRVEKSPPRSHRSMLWCRPASFWRNCCWPILVM